MYSSETSLNAYGMTTKEVMVYEQIKKDILNNEGVTSAVKELITKVESLEKVVLSEQETFIKLINEVFKKWMNQVMF